MILLGSVAACSGDDSGSSDEGASGGDTDSYCDALENAQTQFESLEGESADPALLDEAFDTLQTLGADAPEEVAGDWAVVSEGFANIQQALDDAGLSFADLNDPGALTQLDPEAAQELTAQFESLDSQEFEDAFDSISAHAESECGVDLENGGGGAGG